MRPSLQRFQELVRGGDSAPRALDRRHRLRERLHRDLDADGRVGGHRPRMPARSSPPSPGSSRSARAWCNRPSRSSAARRARRTSGCSAASRRERRGISLAVLPPRSKWIGSMRSPALSRLLLPTMRAPSAKLRASVHGMGSRQGAIPNGAARSQSAPKFSVRRASSGSLPATSALRAPSRAAVSNRARNSATLVSGLSRRISTSRTRTPVSARRASVSRMIGVSPMVS